MRARRFAISPSFSHLRHEPISAGGHGDDVLMVVGLLSQGLPQYRDVPGEPSLFHDRVTPDLLEQFVLRDHALPILDERKERLQDFWSQRYWFAVAQQEPLAGIQRKTVRTRRRAAIARSWPREQFRRKTKVGCKDL